MFDFEKGKIRFIRGGKYPQSNSVLIDDDIRVIIDPACNEEKLISIQRQQPIEIVINSHGHEDHMLYNSLFPAAKFWAPEKDAAVFRDKDTFINQFFHPDDMDKKTRSFWSQFLTEVVKYKPREPNRLLKDGEILTFGQTQVQIMHTPGHTQGHLSFYFLNERVVFLADLDLVKFGPYYGDNASSIEDTLNSLKRLQKIDADVYLVSHGKEAILNGDPVHIKRYADVIYQREEKLLDLLSTGPKTIQEVTDHGIIYGGRKLSNGVWDLSLSEKAMMRKHLERLMNKNIIEKKNEKYYLL